MHDIKSTLDLVREVRSKADESNQKAKSDAEIVSLLNDGQTIATSRLASLYPTPLLHTGEPIQLTAGQTDVPVDREAFEQRVIYLLHYAGDGTAPIEVVRRSHNDVAWMAHSPKARGNPIAWVGYGRTIRLTPPAIGGSIRQTFVKHPGKLVLPAGRVTHVGEDHVVVERLSTDVSLTTESDQLGSYVNVVNWETGEVRVSLQLQAVTGTRLTFRATPQRASVRGRAISPASALATSGIEQDDFICAAEGTCVPFFQGTVAIYLADYAVSRLKLSLDGQNQLEKLVEEEALRMVEAQSNGREPTERVRFQSPVWSFTGLARVRPTNS